MNNNCIIVFLLIFLNSNASAQNIGLNIGDNLPEFRIREVVNSNKKNWSTADFKDKLVIIDFWSTGCSGCVAGLPKMDSLQKKFGSKIQILAVTTESSNVVSSFWKGNKYTKNLSILSVVNDTVFHNYFKHRDIPHEIWIYNNKVIGITNADYVDEYNINKVVNGDVINWPIKNDYFSFNRNIPIFHLNDSHIISYAIVAQYREKVNYEGANGGYGLMRDSISKTVRYFILNASILNVYTNILLKTSKSLNLIKPSPYLAPNEIVWNVRDKSKFFYSKSREYFQEWIRKNGITFETTIRDIGQSDERIYMEVLSKLNNLLNLNVHWIIRREKVYVIRRIKNSGNSSLTRKSKENGKSTYTLGVLADYLNQIPNNPYVFNEIKNEDELPLNISSWTDYESINGQINKYGYQLKSEYREIHKLSFQELNK